MAKLIVTRDGAVIGHHFVDADTFTIGRQPGCNLYIDDSGVSKLHAVIVSVANDQIIEDQGSTNGTLVNGEAITKHILQNNDVIRIGKYSIKFMNQRAVKEMDFDQTMMLDVGVLQAEVARAQPDDKPQGRANLTEARQTGTTFPLGGIRRVIGGETAQAITLNRAIHPLGVVGKSYAVLLRRPHGYYLQPVSGGRQIKVNGKTVPDEQVALSAGDEITVGSDAYSFYLN